MPFVSDEEWILIQQKLARLDELEKRNAELEARLARYENAHTPPSLSGVHVSRVGGNKPGRKKGHEGSGRKTPESIQLCVSLKLKVCPNCGGKLKNKGSRYRTTTGLKPGKTVNTEYKIQRSYCGHCHKTVEPIITDALPNSRFALNLALYITFLSVLGITLSKIRTILLHDYSLSISKATIANTIEQLAIYLGDDYEKLRLQLLEQKDLFCDETSHPVHGKNGWLWTFIGKTVAYLRVEMSRGQKVVEKTLQGYNGVLHSDFWSAYNTLKCDKQKCLAHLTRELKHLREKKKSKELKTYCSKLLRLLRYAKNNNKHSAQFREFCEQRLHAVIDTEYSDKDCQRLNKRLRRHATEIFTFTELETETTNNTAERSLRPCVIKRKNTYGSHSIEGAQAHAVMASFYQTSQLQNKNYEQFVGELLQNRLQNKTEI
jgi:hypothetical protein